MALPDMKWTDEVREHHELRRPRGRHPFEPLQRDEARVAIWQMTDWAHASYEPDQVPEPMTPDLVRERLRTYFNEPPPDTRVDRIVEISRALRSYFGFADAVSILLDAVNLWQLDDYFKELGNPPTAEQEPDDVDRASELVGKYMANLSDWQLMYGQLGMLLAACPHQEQMRRYLDKWASSRRSWGSEHLVDVLVRLDDIEEAAKLLPKLNITYNAGTLYLLIEYFGFEQLEVMLKAAKRRNQLHASFFKVHSGRWAGTLVEYADKPKTQKFAEHYLLNEGANAIDGLIQQAGRKGKYRRIALRLLRKLAADGREDTIRAVLDAGDYGRVATKVVTDEVLDYDDAGLPELPEKKWTKWMKEVEPADLPFDGLPAVLSTDGKHAVPPKLVGGLLAYLKAKEDPHDTAPDGPLVKCTQGIDEASGGRFAWALYEQWLASGTDRDQGFIIAFLGYWGTPWEATRLMRSVRGSNVYGTIGWTISALVRMDSPESWTAIRKLARYLRSSWDRRKATDAMAAKRKKHKWSEEQFRDRTIPTCGISQEGVRIFDFGKRQFHVKLHPPCEIVITEPVSARTYQHLPPAKKDEDREFVAHVRAEYKEFRRNLTEVFGEEIARLEMAMVGFRTWKTKDWLRLVQNHPVIEPLADTLLWSTDGTVFLPTRDDTLIDVDYEDVELGKVIRLAHPTELSDEDREAWTEVLSDFEIVQAFPQLGRGTYTLGDPASDAVLERVKATALAEYKLKDWLKEAGWKPVGGESWRNELYSWDHPREGFKIVAKITPGIRRYTWGTPNDQVVEEVSFRKGKQTIEAKDVPPAFFSEGWAQLAAMLSCGA